MKIIDEKGKNVVDQAMQEIVGIAKNHADAIMNPQKKPVEFRHDYRGDNLSAIAENNYRAQSAKVLENIQNVSGFDHVISELYYALSGLRSFMKSIDEDLAYGDFQHIVLRQARQMFNNKAILESEKEMVDEYADTPVKDDDAFLSLQD
jgi:hypothetical protein